MKIDGIIIPLEMWQLDDLLEKRIEKQRLKIEDLFLVWSTDATRGLEKKSYDSVIFTKYGKLRVFFTSECPKEKAYVLHRSKFNYPNQSNHFTRSGDLIH